jgi:fermentation-respiration switch protein FrsA (DUF1100 family)
MRKRLKIVLVVLLIVSVVLVGFIVWAETPPIPMQEAFNAMQSDSNVTVTNARWLTFQPNSANYTVGFIFYPGGRVDYRSYAPLAHAIAQEGYLAIIVPMPLNLAVLAVNSANDVIAAYPNITSWAIGGHSLGGSMAAQYIHDNPNRIKGLVLLAAYPPSGDDLSKFDLAVTTIHGTNDGLVSAKQIDDSLNQLPSSTVRVEIVGGNHAQFGWYGSQSGDNQATLSREQQQNQTTNATAQLLQKLQ